MTGQYATIETTYHDQVQSSFLLDSAFRNCKTLGSTTTYAGFQSSILGAMIVDTLYMTMQPLSFSSVSKCSCPCNTKITCLNSYRYPQTFQVVAQVSHRGLHQTAGSVRTPDHQKIPNIDDLPTVKSSGISQRQKNLAFIPTLISPHYHRSPCRSCLLQVDSFCNEKTICQRASASICHDCCKADNDGSEEALQDVAENEIESNWDQVVDK